MACVFDNIPTRHSQYNHSNIQTPTLEHQRSNTGTGVCGINYLYDHQGNLISENENKVTAWATANGVTIERHPTCVVFRV